jgi:hypothetical protein
MVFSLLFYGSSPAHNCRSCPYAILQYNWQELFEVTENSLLVENKITARCSYLLLPSWWFLSELVATSKYCANLVAVIDHRKLIASVLWSMRRVRKHWNHDSVRKSLNYKLHVTHYMEQSASKRLTVAQLVRKFTSFMGLEVRYHKSLPSVTM